MPGTEFRTIKHVFVAYPDADADADADVLAPKRARPRKKLLLFRTKFFDPVFNETTECRIKKC